MLTAFNMKKDESSSSSSSNSSASAAAASSSSKDSFEERTKSICTWRDPESVTEKDMFRTDFYYEDDDSKLSDEEYEEKYEDTPKPPMQDLSEFIRGEEISAIPRSVVEGVWRTAYTPRQVMRYLLRYDNGTHLDLSFGKIETKDLEGYIFPFVKLNPQIKSMCFLYNTLNGETLKYLNEKSPVKLVESDYNAQKTKEKP